MSYTSQGAFTQLLMPWAAGSATMPQKRRSTGVNGHEKIDSSCSALQGDFIQSLMDAVGSSLGRRASEMSEYVLNGHLDAAVRASNAQYDDADVLDRLRVKLEKGSASETGQELQSCRRS